MTCRHRRTAISVLGAICLVGFVTLNRVSTPYEVASPHQPAIDLAQVVETLLGLSQPVVYACAASDCDGSESKPNPQNQNCGAQCNCTGSYCTGTGSRNSLCSPVPTDPIFGGDWCTGYCKQNGFCNRCACTGNVSCNSRGPI
jgi:hypothetical protein